MNKINKFKQYLKKMFDYKNIFNQYNVNSLNVNNFVFNMKDARNQVDDYFKYYSGDDEPKNKKFPWKSVGAVIGTVSIVGSLVFLVSFFIFNYSNSSSQNSTNNISSISSYYQNKNDATSNEAMKYILSRTFSVQFVFQSGKQLQIISGTSWIIANKTGTDNYYCGTNLHVAASLTYAGKSSTEADLQGYVLADTYIGFIKESQYSSSVEYINTDINMVRVANPTIAYIASQDKDPTGFGNAYSATSIGSQPKSDLYASIDFAIMEFDFSELSLTIANHDKTQSNSSNVQHFLDWIKHYNLNPTHFYKNATTINADTRNFPRLYMGGFPSTGNQNATYSGSYSDFSRTYLNYGRVSFAGFGGFPLAINDLKENNKTVHLETGSQITLSGYNSYAGSSVYEWYNKESYLLERSTIEYFENNGDLKRYCNLGYTMFLDARSLGGASGSLIVVYDESINDFSVIGIFWGEVSYKTKDNKTFSVGAGNFLNVSPYSFGNINAPGYNIIEYINNSLGTNL